MTDTNRRTGRTTRMLWRALLAASEKPNARVAVVAHSGAWARELAERAWKMLPAWKNGDVRFIPGERRIELPNGSQLVFFATCPEDYGDESWRVGRPDLQVFEDHYVGEVMPHARTALREDVVRRRAKELGVEHLLRTEEEIARTRKAFHGTFVGWDLGRGETPHGRALLKDAGGKQFWGCPGCGADQQAIPWVGPKSCPGTRMGLIDWWRGEAATALDAIRALQAEPDRGGILRPCWFGKPLETWQRELADARRAIESLLQDYWETLR